MAWPGARAIEVRNATTVGAARDKADVRRAQPGVKPGDTVGEVGVGGKHSDRTTVVWFEAWRYQHERAPIVALLQEIRTQLPWYSKALEESRKLGDVTVRGALLALEDLTKRIGIQASKIQEAGERWEEENLARRLPSHIRRPIHGSQASDPKRRPGIQ